MPINLTSYTSIESGLFVRIECDKYRTSPSAGFSTQVLRFSDLIRTVTINSESYPGLGRLLSISSTSSDLRVNGQELTIVVSGIPNASIAEIVNSRIKGSSVEIRRGIFNASTGQLLAISGNPVGRFFGIITNYSLNEEYNIENKTSTNTIVITCASDVEVLAKKLGGRKTNPESQKLLYPSDLGMDNVPKLVGTYFNFGAPQ